MKTKPAMIKSIILCAMLSGIAGCATPYQPITAGVTGGYYQAPLSGTKYIVGFTGNEFTTPSRAYDFTLLRAASIGESLGYNYFTVDSIKPGAGIPAFPGFQIGVTYFNAINPENEGSYYSTANEVILIESKYQT